MNVIQNNNFDVDNGGRNEHIKYLIRNLERSGVSAIVIEDKIGLKTLFLNQSGVKQDSIKNFSKTKYCRSKFLKTFLL